MSRFATTALAVLSSSALPAAAQTPTPDPSTWRPFAYADLQRPSPAAATYADIWKDAIQANNDAYLARGDRRFAEGNAPVTEAHYVIWSPRRSVVLSLLNTATGCTIKERRSVVGATVKLCPLRIAIYEGIQVRTLDGGRGCVLELTSLDNGPASAPPAAAYASYDVPTRTIRTGLVIDHRAVEGCSLSIPLRPS